MQIDHHAVPINHAREHRRMLRDRTVLVVIGKSRMVAHFQTGTTRRESSTGQVGPNRITGHNGMSLTPKLHALACLLLFLDLRLRQFHASIGFFALPRNAAKTLHHFQSFNKTALTVARNQIKTVARPAAAADKVASPPSIGKGKAIGSAAHRARTPLLDKVGAIHSAGGKNGRPTSLGSTHGRIGSQSQRRGGRCRHAKQAFESKQPHQGMQTRNS